MSSEKGVVSKMLRTEWETVSSGSKHVVRVSPEGVVIASNIDFRFGEAGTACSLPDFLNGTCNDIVEHIFGREVLEEVREAVRYTLSTKEYRDYTERMEVPLAYLRGIPLDETLCVFTDISNHEDNGYKHYGAGGEFRSLSGTHLSHSTRLSGKDAMLVYGYADILNGAKIASPQMVAYLLYKGYSSENGYSSERMVDLGLSPEDGIAYGGFFYICSGDSFAVLSETGERINEEKDRQMFGSVLRIFGVMRIGNRVCFKYYWFDRKHPDGFLLFSPYKRTFTARWEEP